MKAVVLRGSGGLDTLKLEEIADPSPGPGQALVRVRGVALSNTDVWARSGPPGGRPVYPWGPSQYPRITGIELAGVVERINGDQGRFADGDPVVVNPILSCGRCEFCLAGEQTMCPEYTIFGEQTAGGMAEFTAVPLDNLIKLPADMPFETAAAAPGTFPTAWRGLVTVGRIQPGQALLVVGASGGVGTAAIQIGRLAGARVLALVGDARKARKAEGLGAIAIDRSVNPDFSRQVLALVDGGVDLAIDPVGAATWAETIRSLRRGGRMVICGASGGERPDFDIREVYQRHRQILGAPMGNQTDFRRVMELVFRKVLVPVIHTTLPLSEIREAHRMFEAREYFGRIVLVP
jgi:NADPH2:quinone reductase